ncbi:MAG: 50S ribosomal protein L9 [Candidatus Paceibacterota bacterium]|jgi:large subunit ribosomal protein L9
MKIILLKDVRKIGKKYDVKDVADGFALNKLIPAGEAVTATPANIKVYEAKRKNADMEIKVQEELLFKNLSALKEASVTISGKTNEKGHLFAAIHADQIVDELKKQAHIDVTPSFLVLDKPVKEIGEHNIAVKVGDKTGSFKLVVKGL